MEIGLFDLERYFLVILFKDDEDLQYRFSNIEEAYNFYKEYRDNMYSRSLLDITVVTEDIKDVHKSK